MPEKEEKNEKEMEIVSKNETIKDTNYVKEHVAFVIKPLPVKQAHRWADWCAERGFEKQHHKAFALAMDILEGRTTDLISSNNRLESLEKLVYVHDTILADLIAELQAMKNQPPVEEPSEEELTREKVRKKREMMKKKPVGGDKNG